ncbi:MAG TPA: transposase [Terrimicrobiaceae bacterium]|jgi:DDE family transposase|nr:transposase [Terrimicrobiaceae bacterium]
MTKKTNCASKASIGDFRDHVAQSLGPASGVLINLIDVLAIGPRPASPVEMTLSPLWGYRWSSLYTGIDRASQELADTIADDDWLQELRKERLAWLASQEVNPINPATAQWRVRILDATDYPRPKTETVKLGYVHGASGMRLGHGLSLLSERVGEGSWTLPLEIGWIPPNSNPITYGVAQLDEFVKRHGWPEEQALAVDAQYTVEPFLNPVHQLGIPILGRVASNRVFFLPPPPYPGFGRPRVRGRKIKLNDARTLPKIGAKEEWELENGGRIEVSRWDDVRMRKWPGQRLALYRVIEYKADGRPRYKRPLWLIFVPASIEIELPTPREAQAIYEERFSVEHSIRFMKGDLGLSCGQFNSAEAEGRVQVWVEMVATAFWFLWVLRAMAETEREKLPGWWRSGKLTPGAVRRLAAGLLLSLGWSKPQPKPRGKSSGRAAGTSFEPRARFKAYRSVSQ